MPRASRLSTPTEFARVFKQGKRSVDDLFTTLGLANDQSIARLGLAVSRKAAPRASTRNRIKRLAREAFRHQVGQLTGYDVVVMAKPAAAQRGNPDLLASLEHHYRTLPARCKAS